MRVSNYFDITFVKIDAYKKVKISKIKVEKFIKVFNVKVSHLQDIKASTICMVYIYVLVSPKGIIEVCNN